MAKKQVDLSKIYGRIQFVRSFPDYKVQVVEHFPDLRVKKVNHFPTKPGLWKIVTSFPDYKIQIVNHFPDFKIKYVNHFPGVRCYLPADVNKLGIKGCRSIWPERFVTELSPQPLIFRPFRGRTLRAVAVSVLAIR